MVHDRSKSGTLTQYHAKMSHYPPLIYIPVMVKDIQCTASLPSSRHRSAPGIPLLQRRSLPPRSSPRCCPAGLFTPWKLPAPRRNRAPGTVWCSARPRFSAVPFRPV
ncbi:hypothetical protein KL86DPRO_10535 [uncultured delta proteobacterium]|uniref:Uncharacterized protein n=1 Tax=uncultured delta proteobacterium TaxID=34034 RepID=A0A212J1Y3_9DELT|nr:hypothetical protein KL86DPRO_10535 [uncultured delta proteobacterium]